MSIEQPVALGVPLTGVQLIEASAGTGKTWTLSGICLRLVVGVLSRSHQSGWAAECQQAAATPHTSQPSAFALVSCPVRAAVSYLASSQCIPHWTGGGDLPQMPGVKVDQM